MRTNSTSSDHDYKVQKQLNNKTTKVSLSSQRYLSAKRPSSKNSNYISTT